MAISATANPMLVKRIIKMMEGKSLSSSAETTAAVVSNPEAAAAGALTSNEEGAAAGASLPGFNQDGASDMFLFLSMIRANDQ